MGKMHNHGRFEIVSFLLKALVSLVKRRICIRIVRFCLSTKDVEVMPKSGLPVIYDFSTFTTLGGEYLPGPITFPLSPRKWVKIELPYRLSEEEWKRIKGILDVFKPGFMKETSQFNEEG